MITAITQNSVLSCRKLHQKEFFIFYPLCRKRPYRTRDISVPYSVNSHRRSSPPKSKPATGQQTNGVCPPVHHVTSRYVNVFVHSLSQSSFIFHTHTKVWGIVCNNEEQRLTATIGLSPRQSQLLAPSESQVGSCLLTRCDMSLCLLIIITH